MYPTLINLPCNITIQSYGAAIASGFVLFYFLAKKRLVVAKLLTQDEFSSLLAQLIIVGVIAGRLFFLVTEPDGWQALHSWYEVIAFWKGGLSIIGTMLGIAIYLPCWLIRKKKPVLASTDIITLYFPLVHALGRIGCFLSGCCYGITTSLPWAIQCPDGPAQCFVHPTHLYSAACFFIIFFILLACYRRSASSPGIVTGCYLALAGFERFMLDFWRAKRTIITIAGTSTISINQAMALVVISFGIIIMVMHHTINRSLPNDRKQ